MVQIVLDGVRACLPYGLSRTVLNILDQSRGIVNSRAFFLSPCETSGLAQSGTDWLILGLL
jgi:hypothetical protein